MSDITYHLGRAFRALISAHPQLEYNNALMDRVVRFPLSAFAEAHQKAIATKKITPEAARELSEILQNVTETCEEPIPAKDQGDWWRGYHSLPPFADMKTNMVSFSEYAQIHHKDPATVRQMALRGSFQTAQKIGRNWVINKEEPYPDNRIKSGKYAKAKE